MFTTQIKKNVARAFARNGLVSRVERLAPELYRVVIRADFEGVHSQVGDKIKVDVGGGMRSYTPSRFSAHGLEFIVQAHATSAGSTWVRALSPGDEIRFFGPVRNFDLSLPNASERITFFGDGTAVGLFERFREANPQRDIRGVIELSREDGDSLRGATFLGAEVVCRESEEYGDALLNNARSKDWRSAALVFAVGEAESVKRLRDFFLTEAGFSRHQLRLKPYWSRYGKAHRKKLERTM